MNNIDEMPPKCHDCPYWEIAKPPYYCPDCEDALNKEMIPMIERCVCCGAEIPEGRQVCPSCESKWQITNRCVMCGAIVYTDGPVCQECMQRLQEARNDL